MNKYKYLQMLLMLGACDVYVPAFAASTSQTTFLVMTQVSPSVYYCTGSTFDASCMVNNTSQLIPSSIDISSAADNALEDQNPGEIGALMQDTSGSTPGPSQMWSYMSGTGAPVSGIAMSGPSTLTGAANPNLSLNVAAYYVPCGTTPSSDGKISGTPVGTPLTSTATSIQNTSQTCNAGGNVYLKFTPGANTLTDTGFITPDTYGGEINLTVSGISG